MKLAVALKERADLHLKLNDIDERLRVNATYQEGENPAEDPKLILKELNEVIKRLEELQYKINLTNAQTKTEKGSLTEVLARIDSLSKKKSSLDDLAINASGISNRYSKTEIKLFPSVDVVKIKKEANELGKEIRELDNLVQETNWTVELI